MNPDGLSRTCWELANTDQHYIEILDKMSSTGDAYQACSCRNIYTTSSWYLHQSSCTSRFPYVDFASNEACYARDILNRTSYAGTIKNNMMLSSFYRAICKGGSSFTGYNGDYIDENGSVQFASNLCNGCPKDYLKGEDGRCHPTPQNCRIAAIDGNTTFCSSNNGCVYGDGKYDGFGGCASAGASISSYSQGPSNGHCSTAYNNYYCGSGSAVSSCKPSAWGSDWGNGGAVGAVWSSYIDENGETKEDLLCADSGCPKGYAKTEDGRCKTLENTEGCNFVWAKGDRAYCGYCKSGYGKTPFGECKPCNPGCKNGCSSDNYTTCNGGCKAGYTGDGCESCTGGKFYQDGECVSSCAEGYYQAGTKCVKNPDGCASYNYTTGRCNDCSGGSYLDGADCKANPEGCDSYNGTSCDVCSGGYYSDSGICKANPTGCTDYSGTYCYSCSSGYLEKDGACIPASNGCGAGYKDMGGFCNRVQWTPAEAAAVLTDDNNNSVTITFKK